MNTKIRKAIVAVATLLAIGSVPVMSQSTDEAWRGGYGDWPVSAPLRNL